jgi:SAM-dependent methyltransferase
MVPPTAQGICADEQVVWEEIACPLCGASDEEELIAVTPPGWQVSCRVMHCVRCGMAYMNPRPDEASIGGFYPEEYEEYKDRGRTRAGWLAGVRGRLERLVLSHGYRYPPPLRHWYEKATATVLKPFLGPSTDSMTALPYQGEGRLLDYGCGSGWYLQRMRERGWHVTGMDFSPHGAGKVRARYGIEVHVGKLPHPAVPPGSFDAITMGCVLEHVHDPHALIEAAATALRPGGMLVIVVQNIDSWGFRVFGPDWWPLELPRHLLHFTPATLRRLVEQHGLEVCEERMILRGGWMRRSLDLLDRRPEKTVADRLLVRLLRPRIVSSLLTRWTARTKQSDCIFLAARRPSSVSKRLAA